MKRSVAAHLAVLSIDKTFDEPLYRQLYFAIPEFSPLGKKGIDLIISGFDQRMIPIS